MITALDFVERQEGYGLKGDSNMFNLQSTVLEDDPSNPPTISKQEFWNLVKERSGIDPPEWQKRKAFNRLDSRRTGTLSYARLKAGSALFDPDADSDPSVARRRSNAAIPRWIDLNADDSMRLLAMKLQEKHNTDKGSELFAHFARACIPAGAATASVSATVSVSATATATTASEQNRLKINFADFMRGLKHYNVLDFSKTSSHQISKKLFSSMEAGGEKKKGYILAKEFIHHGLNEGAQGLGNAAGTYDSGAKILSARRAAHKKNIRDHARSKMTRRNDVTPAIAIDMLREKILSKLSSEGESLLNAHRVFAHAAGLKSGEGKGGISFNFETFQQGFRSLGLLDVIGKNTLKLVFAALDLNSDDQIEFDEFCHILTLDHIEIPSTVENTARSVHSDISEISQQRRLITSRSNHSNSSKKSFLMLPSLSTRTTPTTTPQLSVAAARSKRTTPPLSRSSTPQSTPKQAVTMEHTVFQRWKQMLKLFVAVDKNSKGELGKSEFGDILSRFGIVAFGDEFDKLFEKFDGDGNGTIDYKEFLKHFSGHESNNILATQFSSIGNLETAIDMRNKRERDTDLSINTVHLDPEIHDILADSNVGLATIPGGGKYDVRLLAPILKALQKNELLSGIVSVQKMNQILKWHGINPKEIEMDESLTTEVPSSSGGGGRHGGGGGHVGLTSPTHRRVQGRGGGGGTVVRATPRVVVTARMKRDGVKMVAGIKYQEVLNNIFRATSQVTYSC